MAAFYADENFPLPLVKDIERHHPQILALLGHVNPVSHATI
jgi:hypothetical protein